MVRGGGHDDPLEPHARACLRRSAPESRRIPARTKTAEGFIRRNALLRVVSVRIQAVLAHTYYGTST